MSLILTPLILIKGRHEQNKVVRQNLMVLSRCGRSTLVLRIHGGLYISSYILSGYRIIAFLYGMMLKAGNAAAPGASLLPMPIVGIAMNYWW